jgi:hypothetical protein
MLCVPALGIIGPLYYTALNCPDEHLHRRAMDLLAIPRREGMWDSRTAVALAARARFFRRNSGSSTSSVDSISLASLSRNGSEDPLLWPLNDFSREKGILTSEDWNTAIWDVFPVLATMRPRPDCPIQSTEFTVP